jgi:hypothetical protein
MVRKFAVMLGVGLLVAFGSMSQASAQTAEAVVAQTSPMVLAQNIPDAPPDQTMPGANVMRKTIGWLKWGALGAAVIAVVGGGIASAVGHFGQNYGAAAFAKKWVLGGAAAAVLQALAVPFIQLVAGSV